jgi:hypothetical protein
LKLGVNQPDALVGLVIGFFLGVFPKKILPSTTPREVSES